MAAEETMHAPMPCICIYIYNTYIYNTYIYIIMILYVHISFNYLYINDYIYICNSQVFLHISHVSYSILLYILYIYAWAATEIGVDGR